MENPEAAGKHQIKVGARLLASSHLVRWHHSEAQFCATEEPSFESRHHQIDPKYGRIICWIDFSAGAEFLAKGVCLLNGVEILKPKRKCVPEYPEQTAEQETIRAWAKTFRRYENHYGTRCVDNYGTIACLYNLHLKTLSKKVKAHPHEEDLLISSYKLLGRTIRNRDAHAYVEDVRQEHFYLVRQLFVPCFNILLRWVPKDIRARSAPTQ